MSQRALWEIVAQAADEKKAEDIVVLDLRELSPIADYLVICSGHTRAHLDAIAEAIALAAKGAGLAVYGREGKKDGRWVLIDLGTVIAHVMAERERRYYNLERLWSEAPRLECGPTTLSMV